MPGVLGNIVIPAAVLRELTHASAPESVRSWMRRLPGWLTVQSVAADTQTLVLARVLDEALDPGESEAIQLALANGADFILIDERRGRREAQSRGLKTIGALGVLLEAYRLGLLAEPDRALDELRLQGFRVSNRLEEEFRRAILLR